MARLIVLLLHSPWRSLKFLYALLAQVTLVLLRRILLPHFPVFQSLRLQVQRAYLSTASIHFPEIVHRLPVSCSETRAKIIAREWTGYIIPGTKSLRADAEQGPLLISCVVLFAHGGGYARGEARMYLKYMERWIESAKEEDVDLMFLSVEYPLTTKAAHPAQRSAFVSAYRHLLDSGITPGRIIFMGDSAGGGLSILSAIELHKLQLPQPAGSVLISPWIDMDISDYDGGCAWVESDYIISANTLVPMLTRLFLRDISGASPDANPLYHRPEDVRYLNPQLILVGSADITLQDCKRWARVCEKAKVRHELVIEWGQLHVYALGSAFIDPEIRRKTDRKILHWMKACMKERL